MVVIETDRLILRPPVLEEAGELARQIGDWEVVRMLARPPWPYRLSDAEAFIRSLGEQTGAGGVLSLAIRRKQADELIGMIGTVSTDDESVPELGYWLGKAHWRQGYMSEAARALLDRAFRAGGVNRLISGYYADNVASGRLQDRLGFAIISESTKYCVPRKAWAQHIDTVLTRAAYESRVP